MVKSGVASFSRDYQELLESLRTGDCLTEMEATVLADLTLSAGLEYGLSSIRRRDRLDVLVKACATLSREKLLFYLSLVEPLLEAECKNCDGEFSLAEEVLYRLRDLERCTASPPPNSS